MKWVVCLTDKQKEQITKINKAEAHDHNRVYNPHSKFNHTKEGTTSTRSKQRVGFHSQRAWHAN